VVVLFRGRESMGLARYRTVKVNSGVEAVLDTSLEMRLDDFGQYAPVRIGTPVPGIDDSIRRVNITDPSADDQTKIGTRLFGADPDINHDDMIGYYRGLYIGHVVDDDERLNSTSGGLSTWILCSMLEHGVVDGVIHMRQGRGGLGPLFEYGISKTVSEVREAAKTRYYPGEVSRVLNEIRNGPAGRRFVLVGIPEVVAEVRLLSKELPEFGELVPFTVGLLCAHQKTTRYLESMAWQLGIDPRSLKDADFRFKRPGERADRYLTRITGSSGGAEVTKVLDPDKNLVANWGLGFFKSDFSDFTDDVFNETADVALGDAWLPEYSSDYRGNNVIIVRNPVVETLIREGMESGQIELKEVDVETVCRCQAGLVRHSHDELGYRLFRLVKAGITPPRTRVPPSGDIPFLRKLEQVQRMGNAGGSRWYYLRAEKSERLGVFRRFARWRVFIHRIVRVFDMLTRMF